MTKIEWYHYYRYRAALTVALMVLISALMSEGQAQVRQSLKISVRASPEVSIARMDMGAQQAFANGMPRLTEMFQDQSRGVDFVNLSSGFSIKAYENIPVLLSFTVPVTTRPNKDDPDAMRITCGYLNDGTTNFMRATITDRSPMQFSLQNNGLLRRSMHVNDPVFVAHIFFLINLRKEDTKHGSTATAPTVTVEFM